MIYMKLAEKFSLLTYIVAAVAQTREVVVFISVFLFGFKFVRSIRRHCPSKFAEVDRVT